MDLYCTITQYIIRIGVLAYRSFGIIKELLTQCSPPAWVSLKDTI